MYKKLKKCKNFAEIYSVMGEQGFSKVAEVLLIILCISPLLAGVVNAYMLIDIYTYNAYEYNDRFMAISNTIFALITLFIFTYTIGRIRYNKWYIEDVIIHIRKKEPWLIFWLCLLVWGFITSLPAYDMRGAFFGATELSGGYISHIYMLCVMVCGYLLSEEGIKKLLKVYVVVSDILAIIMLAYQFDIPFFRMFTATTGISVFTNSNHYGYYLAVATLWLAGLFYISIDELEEKKNYKPVIIYLVSYEMHIYALMINDTLGAFFGIVFGLLALFIFWCIRMGRIRPMYFLPLGLLAVTTIFSYFGAIPSKLGGTIGLSLVIFLQDLFKVANQSEGYRQAGTNRIQLWLEAINAISQKPILGFGPDMMIDRWGYACVSMTPHNEYLECALYMGIPGLLMYLGGLITLFVSRVKRIRKLPPYMIVAAGAIIAYLVSAFFGVRKYHTVDYLFLFIGFVFLKDRIDEKTVKSGKK